MKNFPLAIALGATLWCQGALAQGFNKRYDAFGLGYVQGAWGLERSGDGWVIFSASYEPDTIVAPDSIIGTYVIILEHLGQDGQLLGEQRHRVHRNSIYLGWADCCDSVVGGGYVNSGSIAGLDIPDSLAQVRLMRYDANGDTLWTRDYGDSTHYWIGAQVKQTQDGGFLMVGFTDATGYQDGFAIKTDMQGNEQWRQTYGLGGIVIDDYSDIAILEDGYLLAGETYTAIENSDFLVTRITETGSEVWSARFGSPFDEPNASIERLSDGRYVVWGLGSGRQWLAGALYRGAGL